MSLRSPGPRNATPTTSPTPSGTTTAGILRAASRLALASSLVVASPATADEVVGWGEERWIAEGDVEWTREAGQPPSGVELGANGTVVLREPKLEHGTIELEMMLSGQRAFAYVQFRCEGGTPGRAGGEEIYFRSHKTQAPDALQYTSAYPGGSNWQLYHGEGGTAAVDLPSDTWIPVRLRFRDRTLEVEVGRDDVADPAGPPALRAHLERPPAAGAVALRGFVPRGSGAAYAMRVRNLRISSEPPELEPAAPVAEVSGAVRRWRLSPAVAVAAEAPELLEAIPAGLAGGADEVVEARPDGLVVVLAHRDPPPDARRWAAVGEVDLVAQRAGRRRLDLGYSDAVSVFLDGELLFAADDSYSYDAPRRQGLVGLHQATLYLPLKPGRNRLRVLVADRFGGWALQARIEDREGLDVEP